MGHPGLCPDWELKQLRMREGFGDGVAVFAGIGGAEVDAGGEIAFGGLAAAHVRGEVAVAG